MVHSSHFVVQKWHAGIRIGLKTLSTEVNDIVSLSQILIHPPQRLPVTGRAGPGLSPQGAASKLK